MSAVQITRVGETTARVVVTVELDVDLTDWATAYGLNGHTDILRDVRESLPTTVAYLLTVRPDRDRQPGDPLTVGAPDNGTTLSGDLADWVD